MILRWVIAVVFGLGTLAAAGMTVYTWSEPDGGRWMFLAFAAWFALLTWSAARPPKPRPETGTKFVPAWFFDGAILVLGVLVLLVIASCVFGRR